MIELTDKEFQQIKDIMYRQTGVFLKETKKPLVVTRLRKRLEELNFSSFSEYIALLQNAQSPEFEIFINAITTNETYLFRHGKQFEYLRDTMLPECAARNRVQGKPEVTVWSAACSTGEEPYSLAIILYEFLLKRAGVRGVLYASDVNSEVIADASRGIYDERSFRETPPELKERYFKPVVNQDKKIVKTLFSVDPKIRTMVQFKRHNLLTVFSVKNIDIIFLRNCMIYFDTASKQTVVSNIEKVLVPGGYLVISLSESLNDVKSSMKFLTSGIYQKT